MYINLLEQHWNEAAGLETHTDPAVQMHSRSPTDICALIIFYDAPG